MTKDWCLTVTVTHHSYLSVHLAICLFKFPSTYPLICLSIYIPICLSICLSIYLFLYPFVSPSINSLIYFSVFLQVYFSCPIFLCGSVSWCLSFLLSLYASLIIMIMTLKGVIPVFFCFTISSLCRCLQHVHSSGQGAIVCKLRATHQALSICNMLFATCYKGTAQLLSMTELKLHLF